MCIPIPEVEIPFTTVTRVEPCHLYAQVAALGKITVFRAATLPISLFHHRL